MNTHTEMIPLLPLKNVVVLPKTILPVIVGRQRSIAAVEYALKNDIHLFITTQKDATLETPEFDDVYQTGTRAKILQVMRMPNGSLKILTEGICRAKMTATHNEADFTQVTCHDLDTIYGKNSIELQALWRQLHSLYETYAQLDEKAPEDIIQLTATNQEIDHAADTIAMHITNLTLEERQRILELPNLTKRLYELCAILEREIEILRTESRIRGHVQTQVDKNQREYYLNEQMKAIQKELGREDQSAELEEMHKKLDGITLSAEAREKVIKELRRLEQMPPMSPEAVVSRNFIDWITSLPWDKKTTDTISIQQAEKILNKYHAGLKRAKDRIIEFLAAKKFNRDLSRSPIICLAGPPGVGKTTLAKSIAESLGREFVRISLGGVRDEAEIRGHRRTYIGALPGKLIQSMKKADSINPVILLDEIDKISRDSHGDPAAALLEVLDPEQNKQFVDHFLDTGYDLSQVMFIATANNLENIPYALYDRLEIIHLAGYTLEEKVAIVQNFVLPRNLKDHGLTKRQFKIDATMIEFLIDQYTREAGVRHIDRLMSKLIRKSIQEILNGTSKSVTITREKIVEWCGNPPHKRSPLDRSPQAIGLATGLAWTEVGGDILEIEVTALPGKGNVTLTGQLGEVMQESAQAAMSYLRSRAQDVGLKSSFHATKDIHVHIPEGATPKDGPSAGITLCSAFISALTKIPTRTDVALTGEITLQGRVLAVGGLKEKLLAAQQFGIKTVIVPHENKEEILDICKEINVSALQIVYAKTMHDVLEVVFDKKLLKKSKIGRKTTTRRRSKELQI